MKKNLIIHQDSQVIFEDGKNGVYTWADDSFNGKISAYEVSEIVYQFFKETKDAKQVRLPCFINEEYGIPEVSRQSTFLKTCVEVLMVIQV